MTLVTEMVPELLNYKQRTQLILGLRAQLILELLKRMDNTVCEAIQDHLNSFQRCSCEGDQDGEVEVSKSAFVELVQTLLREQSQKEYFFKEVFPLQYGVRFDTALQLLVWEFFSRLEELLPVPSFSQVFSMFDLPSSDSHLQHFVSDYEDLKMILQHQQERQKLTKSEFTFTSDTILIDEKTHLGGVDGQQDAEKPQGRNQVKIEEETLQHVNSCRVEDAHEDDEETDDSSTEAGPNSQSQEYGLSPLTSSPCSEGADAADDRETAGDASRPPRCSESPVEGATQHLDLCRNEEPSEESAVQPSTGGDSVRAVKNTCLECGKTFSSCSTLKNHCFVHTSARPFKCTQCDKTYKSRKDLNQHVLIHSKPKVLSFACSLCEKRFSSQGLLTVHLRHHTGERPFACSYCDKRFSLS